MCRLHINMSFTAVRGITMDISTSVYEGDQPMQLDSILIVQIGLWLVATAVSVAVVAYVIENVNTHQGVERRYRTWLRTLRGRG